MKETTQVTEPIYDVVCVNRKTGVIKILEDSGKSYRNASAITAMANMRGWGKKGTVREIEHGKFKDGDIYQKGGRLNHERTH